MSKRERRLANAARSTRWRRLVGGDGAEEHVADVNPADLLILGAWRRSVEQAVAAGFERDDAKDIASEAMTAVLDLLAMDPALLERPEEFERRRHNAVKTRVFSWRRSRARVKRGTGELSRFLDAYRPGWMSPDQRVEFTTGSDRLNEALATLTPAAQVAVFLRHGMGWMPKEIAEFTGEPIGKIKIRIHRGLAALRDAFTVERAADSTDKRQ